MGAVYNRVKYKSTIGLNMLDMWINIGYILYCMSIDIGYILYVDKIVINTTKGGNTLYNSTITNAK